MIDNIKRKIMENTKVKLINKFKDMELDDQSELVEDMYYWPEIKTSHYKRYIDGLYSRYKEFIDYIDTLSIDEQSDFNDTLYNIMENNS
jgi:hypothetical protein